MKRPVKILLIVLACVAALAALAVAGLNIYFHASVAGYFRRSQPEGPVPGLADGFIPQGFSRVPEEDLFLTCGYMNDGSASRIYLYSGRSAAYALLADVSGAADTAHAGGLTFWNGYVLLAHGNEIAVYPWADVKDAAHWGGSVAPTAAFDVGFGAAFCHAKGNRLYVGEFYRDVVYPTDSSHHMTTGSGDMHHAILCVYDLDQIQADGFHSAVPLYVYSVTDQAQGMCVTDAGSLCISTSWGLTFSHIHVYADPADGPADGTFSIGGTSVPLYHLDSARELEDISLIPMCEELYYLNGRVLFTNESASAKYKFGKLTGGGRIFSIAVP